MKNQFYVGSKGEMRWKSNDSVIHPNVCVENNISFDSQIQRSEYDAYTTEFLNEYIEYREKNGYSEEERAEMLAAFGPGVELVDVATGHRITT